MVILAINPSNETNYEFQFWNKLRNQLKLQGHELILISTAYISPLIQSTHIKIFAKLIDLNNQLSDYRKLDSLPFKQWWNNQDIELLVAWESLKWNTKNQDEKIRNGLVCLLNFISASIVQFQPDVVITSNKIEPICYLYKKIANKLKIGYLFFERSPLGTFWIEESGMFAESNIFYNYKQIYQSIENYNSVGQKELSYLITNPYGFRSNQSIERTKEDFDEKFILLIMDNVLWTGWAQENHPQNKIDYPQWPSYRDAIIKIYEVCQKLDHRLYIRPHPSDQISEKISLPDNAIFTKEDLTKLICRSSSVICFNSKVSFNVLALGKPLVVLGTNPISVLSSIATIEDIEELRVQLSKNINFPQKSDLPEFINFLGWLSAEYFIDHMDPNDIKKITAMICDKSSDSLIPTATSDLILIQMKSPLPRILSNSFTYFAARFYLEVKEWIIRQKIVRSLYLYLGFDHPLEYAER